MSVSFPVELPFHKAGGAPPGWDTTVVSYASDLPFLAAWGEGYQLGPGHHPGRPHRRRAHPQGRPAPGRGALRPPGRRPPRTRGVMSAKIPVCILGATGTVGQKFVRLLADHPWFEVAAVAASARAPGKRYGDVVRWREQAELPARIADLTVQECAPPLPGADRLLGARRRGGGADRAGVRAGGSVRRHQHPHPPHGPGRAAAHPRGQRRSPRADRPPAEGAGLERRDPGQPELLHRGAGARAGAAAPRLRGREALRLHHAGGVGRGLPGRGVARHRWATSSRTSAAKRRRSSGRAARSSAPWGRRASSRRHSPSARTPTASR